MRCQNSTFLYTIRLVAFVSLLVSLLLVSTITRAFALEYIGSDRYQTAAMVAVQHGGKDVTIASGENFPDALSAANLGNPILLVSVNEIPQATVDALLTIVPDSITIIGGEGVISSEVAAQLETYIKPIIGVINGDSSHADLRITLHPHATRIAGADRYETNALTIQGTDMPVTVVSGENWPDAISASNLGNQIFLVRKDSIPPATGQALAAANPCSVIIVGGTGVVSQDVEEQLAAYCQPSGSLLGSATRLGGIDRYDTNLLTIGDATVLNLVKGTDYPDALASSLIPGQVMLLGEPSHGSPANASYRWIQDHRSSIESTNYIGGGLNHEAVDAARNGTWIELPQPMQRDTDPLVTYTIAAATQREWDLMWAIASRESGMWERNSGNGYYGPWQMNLSAIQSAGYPTVDEMFESHDRQYDAAVKYAYRRYGSLEAANEHSMTCNWW